MTENHNRKYKFQPSYAWENMEIHSNPQPQKAMALLKENGLPVSDLNIKKFQNFLYLDDEDNIVGIIGLEIFDSIALLRSLAVRKEAQSKGHGKKLVSAIENYAKKKNIKEIYLLTETAEDFFKKLNYCLMKKEAAPEAIKATSEFSSVCPVSAVLMMKELLI